MYVQFLDNNHQFGSPYDISTITKFVHLPKNVTEV